ncbi:hypothetical protein GKE82_24195 [Conexibacter sp. W3-3-2]|uniref:hypothetical protein n=1 Tax=Conexibacter sp. W3-3-2 TaxID=2675227 RepID=UPI0012B91DB3|nr:hypothetical protein [Conexibacter sp. W3-3-2]MTD47310.1 hypothetical protein [Conexibacter sp. W3-3-2]
MQQRNNRWALPLSARSPVVDLALSPGACGPAAQALTRLAAAQTARRTRWLALMEQSSQQSRRYASALALLGPANLGGARGFRPAGVPLTGTRVAGLSQRSGLVGSSLEIPPFRPWGPCWPVEDEYGLEPGGTSAGTDGRDVDALRLVLRLADSRLRRSGVPAPEYEMLINQLADACARTSVVGALRELVGRAPHLKDGQRLWLDQGLGYVAEGEWVLAIPFLLLGLEGAIRSVEPQARTHRDRGKIPGVEAFIKTTDLPEEYKMLIRRHVYGRPGNSFRHGDPDGDARAQAVLATFAIAWWLGNVTTVAAGRALTRASGRRSDLPRPRPQELALPQARP